MKFDKSVLFLGMQEQRLSDGGKYYTVQFYDKDSGPVNVNVMDSATNEDTLIMLRACDFGSPVIVTFALRAKERLWKLVLDHVG